MARVSVHGKNHELKIFDFGAVNKLTVWKTSNGSHLLLSIQKDSENGKDYEKKKLLTELETTTRRNCAEF